MISHERLAEIKSRCEAAPPGPWRMERRPYALDIVGRMETEGASMTLMNMGCYGHNEKLVLDTATFITHARSDVPDLLAENEFLRQENARMKAAIMKAPVEGLSQ